MIRVAQSVYDLARWIRGNVDRSRTCEGVLGLFMDNHFMTIKLSQPMVKELLKLLENEAKEKFAA